MGPVSPHGATIKIVKKIIGGKNWRQSLDSEGIGGLAGDNWVERDYRVLKDDPSI
jgi:hypothetical protein